MLTMKDISVAYDNRLVLDGVSLEIPTSSMTGIIGPNGAGKSTLIKAVLNIITHEGASFIDNQALSQVESLKKVAYVEQKAAIDIHFPIKVKECVALGLFPKIKFWSRLKKEDWAHVQKVLALVNLSDYADCQISQLSGGQFQRMLLARCLVQGADYLFLDEPFVGIDAVSEEMIIKLLRELRKKGKTILIVHHDLSKVEAYFDHVLFLNRKVLAFGRTAEVLTRDNLKKTYGAQLFMRGDQ